MDSIKLLTIFTPTYNRKHLLPRLYESLKIQTNSNFIWMIIDDGSTDGTGHLVKKWQIENLFEIQYFYKVNEGMHSAHNWAYDRIQTTWNTCIDSDDKMPPDGVQIISEEVVNIKDESIQCLVGLDSDFDNIILGNKFPNFYDKVKISAFMKSFKIEGDKKFVFKTEIMKTVNLYPVFPGEKLVPLNYKYLLAEQFVYFKPINKILCNVEYQIDGSTKNMLQQYRRNPHGFAFFRIYRINECSSFDERLKSAIHLVSSTLFSKNFAALFKTTHTLLVLTALPLGILLNFYIRLKTKKNS